MKIKKELEAEYKDYVEKNNDPYGGQCVKAGEVVMNLLDEGKSCEEAEEGLHGFGLTGYMAGAAISAVCHFHERGDEMKAWWNRNQGGTPDENGVNNPAIITISPPLLQDKQD